MPLFDLGQVLLFQYFSVIHPENSMQSATVTTVKKPSNKIAILAPSFTYSTFNKFIHVSDIQMILESLDYILSVIFYERIKHTDIYITL